MKTYKIWDKQEKINGVDKEHIINNLQINYTDGVFLILDEHSNVQAIEIDRIIKGVYNLSSDLTTEQVAQEYLRIKEEEEIKAQKEQITLEEQAVKISILEAQNKDLEDALVELASMVGGA